MAFLISDCREGDNFRPGISKSVAAELQISSEIIIFRVSQIVPIPPKKESSLTPKLRQATDKFTFFPSPPPMWTNPVLSGLSVASSSKNLNNKFCQKTVTAWDNYSKKLSQIKTGLIAARFAQMLSPLSSSLTSSSKSSSTHTRPFDRFLRLFHKNAAKLLIGVTFRSELCVTNFYDKKVFLEDLLSYSCFQLKFGANRPLSWDKKPKTWAALGLFCQKMVAYFLGIILTQSVCEFPRGVILIQKSFCSQFWVISRHHLLELCAFDWPIGVKKPKL